MRTTTITAVLTAAGMHQRLYAEPTVVEEFCGTHGSWCDRPEHCCAGHYCDYDAGGICWCYVC
jgi:hypothetical protein